MNDYSRPELIELGNITEITKGQHFSYPDGYSGTVGNRGEGNKGRDG